MSFQDLDYSNIKEKSILGRYVSHRQLAKYVNTLRKPFSVETMGLSVENRSIESITVGSGKQRILMWSQMHGNESTTTKAVLDLMNFLNSEKGESLDILQKCTLKIIPMLNPDGAEVYTRVNANKIDLNRDAKKLTQPESKLLRTVYEDFRPHYCLNLHDQRTIFNVGHTPKPATASFLAPASDEQRTITESRKKSMKLVGAIDHDLNSCISGQIGRYDDTYNANCVGDTFQALGTPTVLFEAGHFVDDYEREQTRKYIFYALVLALKNISEDGHKHFTETDYFNIPENNKQFFDILILNASAINSSFNGKDSLGILYTEVLKNGKIHFVPKIEMVGELEGYFGHQSYNCLNSNDLKLLKQQPFWEDIAN
ncbi:M14 family metallopeptidase [Ulvibacterium marinum]|uniref:Peptidase M14 n=1 Tax=Ulvibacterium marinum TaxID=2419782 RepID=A0A3B0CBH1_9FLAO|nr:M14 metallopeptidase family protein [Ulvibacterium marinum]RKN80977.1 peptidase M14 [Ulvibacterium marinum]